MKSPSPNRRRKGAKPALASLAALGAERLAELLLAAATADPALMRSLSLEIAVADGDVAGEIDKQIVRLRKATGWLDSKKAAALARELEGLVKAITETLGAKDPEAALGRLFALMGLAPSVLERGADTGPGVAGAFRAAIGQIGGLIAQVTPAPAREAQIRCAFEVFMADEYGVAEDLIGEIAGALDGPGREALRALIEADLKALQSRTDAGRASLYRFWTLTAALADLADAEGDVDAYIAAQQRRGPRVRDDAGIAARLLAADRAAEALAAIDAAEPNPAKPADVLADLRIAALDAMDRREEAQAARWARFQNDLSVDALRAYLKRLPDFDDVEREQVALDLVQGHPDTLTALAFLIAWPDLRRAGALIRQRLPSMDGDGYWVLTPAAEALAHKDPLASTLLRRLMIDFALEAARSGRYGHAARHLAECAGMARAVQDWEDFPDHEVYMAGLEKDHGRKFSFWDRVTP